MELELKHLVAYLPYGLKLMSESEHESSEPNIYDLNSIDVGLKMANFGWGAAKELTEIKPILRPLSDITKEITHNGETFVPIIKLAKMDADYKDVEFSINEMGNCLGRLNAGVVVVFQIDDEIPFIKEVYNNFFGDLSGNDYDDMHVSSVLPSQIKDKLHEWHFDTFGLLESGLAIDINTLNNQS